MLRAKNEGDVEGINVTGYGAGLLSFMTPLPLQVGNAPKPRNCSFMKSRCPPSCTRAYSRHAPGEYAGARSELSVLQ